MTLSDLTGTQIDWNLATVWAIQHVPPIVIILALALAAHLIIRRVLARAVRAAISRGTDMPVPDDFTKRRDTLGAFGMKTVLVVMWSLVIFTLLSELGVPIAPMLAGVSVVGLAVGFGAQSLVRDIITGIFILVENQYSRGDVVTLAGVNGKVESINLRRTVLRDLNGVVHNIPNGDIRVASNFTRSWARTNVDVMVSYDTDLSHVEEVINHVGAELAADPQFGPLIIEAPHMLRVEGFGDTSMQVKILGMTQPHAQWQIAGVLRRRLKAAFDAEGIAMTPAHREALKERQETPARARSDQEPRARDERDTTNGA